MLMIQFKIKIFIVILYHFFQDYVTPVYFQTGIPVLNGDIDKDKVPESFQNYYTEYTNHFKRIADAFEATDPMQERVTYMQTESLNNSTSTLESMNSNLEYNEQFNNAKQEVFNFSVDNLGNGTNAITYLNQASTITINIIDRFFRLPTN